MKKKTTNLTSMLRPYVPPYTEIIQTQTEQFICTSVGLNQGNSSEDPWDPETPIEGDEFEFE